MTVEYVVEKVILDFVAEFDVNERFTQEQIISKIKSNYNVDINIQVVQRVLSSYISDGIVGYDDRGYHRTYKVVIG